MTANQRVENISSLNSHENYDYTTNYQQQQQKYSLQLRAVLSNQSLININTGSIYRMSNEQSTNLSQMIDENTNEKIILNNYILIESTNLNETSYGTAYHTVRKQYYYWKKFDKKDYMKKLEAYYIMESSLNIYKFIELISNSTYVYIVFDLNYGDLHSYMKEKKQLNESEARRLFGQCVQVVDECHQNGIIVRDIKLKKFVFLDSQRTKLGLANLEDCIILDDDAESDLIKSKQGCPAYVSPEVLNSQQYSYSGRLSDSWSLGIILFALLVGRYPFHDQTIPKTFAKISRAKFQIPPSSGISLDARILIRSLIRYQPSERLLPNEILNSNWFKQYNQQNQIQSDSNLKLTQAVHYMTSLTSNTVVNNGNLNIQRKPLEASLSAPTFNQSRNISNIRSQLALNDRIVPDEF